MRSAALKIEPLENDTRLALADAVANRASAAQALDAARKALADFEARLNKTVGDFYDRQDALSAAKSDFESELATHAGDESALIKSRLRQGRLAPREEISVAEQHYVQAKQRYDAAKTGHVAEKAKVEIATDAFGAADRTARERADAVMLEILPKLLNEAEALHRDLLKRRAVIEYLASAVDGVTMNTSHRTPFGSRIVQLINDVPLRYEHESLRADALAPWKAAKDTLVADASALLPTAEA